MLLEWTSPGDAALLPEDAIPGADPCDPDTWHLPGDDDDDDTTPRTGRGCENEGCTAAGEAGTVSPLLFLGLWLLSYQMMRRRTKGRW